MKNFLILIWATFLCSNVFSQNLKHDPKLQKIIEEQTKGFGGVIGVYVENIKTGKFAAVNADTIFPTASMIKIPIMIGLFSKILDGTVTYDQPLTFKDSLKYDNGIVGSFKDSTKIPISELIFLMESVSDNTASLWLQGIVKGQRINEIMDSLGMVHTRMNTRTPGRSGNWKIYGWGQTSPREMASLMKKLRNGEIYSPDASLRMYRTLGNQYWDGEGLSQIPENVKTAYKSGAVDRSRSEVMYVHAPHGEYVYCLITKNQNDTSWTKDNEGYKAARSVSAALWKYFEPKSKWKLPKNYDKWL
ncbi:serine hydrolase [Lacihabitans sp. LS3-19]|uniref:serine hydrolase n=1 Tax=Lacihabitans sp. LS3-19 TaxID=2487335 RepID=UPI0020CD42AD|nr:serine hydrolase [Lacihabitans sp. LS3-19]MCP9766943.1 serine hydrolase [Lacihabitans sp. LS3-19]